MMKQEQNIIRKPIENFGEKKPIYIQSVKIPILSGIEDYKYGDILLISISLKEQITAKEILYLYTSDPFYEDPILLKRIEKLIHNKKEKQFTIKSGQVIRKIGQTLSRCYAK